jgi:curved DNA-binding protein CbpA
MKNYLNFLLLLLVWVSLSLAPDMPLALPEPTKDQPFDEFFFDQIAKMSPEELDELAKIGEQIAKDMEAQGIDVDKFIEDQLRELSQPQPSPTQGPTKEKQDEVKVTTPSPKPTVETKKDESKEEVLQVPVDQEKEKKLLLSLSVCIEKIPEIMRQVLSSRHLTHLFKPLFADLEEFGYYAYSMRQPKLLKYGTTPAFVTLYDNITRLSSIIEEYEPLLFVADPATQDPYTVLGVSKTATSDQIERSYLRLLRKYNPERVISDLDEQDISDHMKEKALKKADKKFKEIEKAYYDIQRIEKARSAFEAIKQAFVQYINPILIDAHTLLQAYQPEALALKEAQDQREAEAKALAKEAGEKEAPYAPYVFEFKFPSTYGGDYGAGSNSKGYYTPPSYPTASYGTEYTSGLGSTPYSPSYGGTPSHALAGSGSSGSSSSDGKKTDDKESKEQDKELEKKKKEKEKAKQEETSFAIKLTLRKEVLDKIAAYLDDTYDGKNKRSSLFTNFYTYLETDDIKEDPYTTQPYDSPATLAALIKPAALNTTLDVLSTIFIKPLVEDLNRDIGSLSGDKKNQFKEKMREAVDKITKDYIKKSMPDLLDMTINFSAVPRELIYATGKRVVLAVPDKSRKNAIKAEKLYLHFGVNAFDFPSAPPAIAMYNPTATNFVATFVDGYKKLLEVVKK